ncbi:MAG: CRTAC1 family protein, partial [Balneolaceae bacterium]|nr:CRTAC1 family protein [Balneolaceae bacterium]
MLKPLLKNFSFFVFLSITLNACTQTQPQPLFDLLSSDQTNVNFENNLDFSDDLNIYKYRNYYNGGGVAAGDINNDGLPDLYFVSNQGENKLFINNGDFTFSDITDKANVAGTKPWSTGVAMVDIDHDGYLDIYVSNSGLNSPDERKNELFINNGDNTFREAADEFGLDHAGYTIQANFFDYDRDGDLDVYLLNNSNTSPVSFELSNNQRDEIDEYGGDKLLENDGGFFIDITEEAGIYSSDIGFSLSASVSDLNKDGYPDLYIANDFFERDYLYLNNGDGSFDEVLEKQINSISAASMGADIADLSNDGWMDIYVADMLPLTDQRTKQITTYENWDLFSDKQSFGYHWQVTRNTLQLNNGDSTYSEVGRLANVQATDWSWAVLMADYDLNGFNDILVTNGLVQDITNLDYIEEISTPDMIRSIVTEENVDFRRLVEMIPSNPVPNIVFSNHGDLSFENAVDKWGFDEPTFSSGAAWADLDNDGALDLVINDINGPAKIYRNKVTQEYPDRYSLRIQFEGSEMNPDAIGAEVEIWTGDIHQVREHYLQRGYQSSVQPGIYFGIPNRSTVDSLIVKWPDGRISKRFDIELPSTVELTYDQSENAENQFVSNQPATIQSDLDKPAKLPAFTDISETVGFKWTHQENSYNDFNREKLLLQMRSTEGPALCKGDINNDGLEDIYLGGASEQA